MMYVLTAHTIRILKFLISSDVYSRHTEKIVFQLLRDDLGNEHAVYLETTFIS